MEQQIYLAENEFKKLVDFISVFEHCWWLQFKYVMYVYFFPLFLNSGRLSGAVVEKARSFVFVI